MRNFRIIGTGSAYPEESFSNDDLAKIVDTSDEWIRARTGVAGRHICIRENVTDIAVRAAKNALADAWTDGSELDLIICSTLRGDYATPSLSCMLQKEIGATCPGFDINCACSGFIYALDMAESYFASGKVKKILVIAAESMSRIVDWHDRATCVLFGDGAGAVVLEPGDALLSLKLTAKGHTGFLRIASHRGNIPFKEADLPEPQTPVEHAAIGQDEEIFAKGNGEEVYPYLLMDGQEVYRFAISSMCKDIPEVIEKAGLTKDDVDMILPHQANIRIIEGAKSRMKIPREKFKTNLERFGNTSSASIPLLLDELHKNGELKPGMILVFSAFGAGLTSGACVIRWELNQ